MEKSHWHCASNCHALGVRYPANRSMPSTLGRGLDTSSPYLLLAIFAVGYRVHNSARTGYGAEPASRRECFWPLIRSILNQARKIGSASICSLAIPFRLVEATSFSIHERENLSAPNSLIFLSDKGDVNTCSKRCYFPLGNPIMLLKIQFKHFIYAALESRMVEIVQHQPLSIARIDLVQ